jgi:hypothetical protein
MTRTDNTMTRTANTMTRTANTMTRTDNTMTSRLLNIYLYNRSSSILRHNTWRGNASL